MAKGRSRAGGRAKKTTEQDAPDVYQQMLAEAEEAAARTHDPEGKTVKKRRVGGRIVLQHPPDAGENGQDMKDEPTGANNDDDGQSDARQSTASLTPEPMLQTIDYNPEDSEDSEDDEFFEDVDIEGDGNESDIGSTTKPTDGETLNLVLKDENLSEKASSRRRRAVTAISDKKMTFRVHKMHLLCLLSHLSLRNHWCNDARAQLSLRKLAPKKVKEHFVDNENDSQYTRDLRLREGLQQLAELFRSRFHKTARGMTRAWWDAPENNLEAPSFDDLDLLSTVQDFRRAATSLEGSRDVGAQLFCALLRACGLEVRLVHSLQALPINGAVRPEQQQAPRPAQTIRYEDRRLGMAGSNLNSSSSVYHSSYSLNPEEDLSTEAGRASGIRRKLAKLGGRSSLQSSSPSAQPKPSQHKSSGQIPSAPGSKRFRESSCPVYWVEVFSPAYQKWIPMDPLVTNSFSKPPALCPAQKDAQNMLAYVIGMEEDGSARDITRRYSSTYNAKTRKLRVDGIVGSDGSKWWRKVLRMYASSADPTGFLDARNSIEDAEFKRREAREGMPKNVEDFKGHPLYVLERHVRRNEVIHPKRQVGTAGGERNASSKGKAVEAVFRRQDVHPVKSADAWYRLGREIKVGEQTLKRVPLKRRFERSESEVEDEDQGLYAFFQTELYQAPPVMLGKIPRNDYGNLDVYVPSMIPPGGVHILHHDAKHAARLLKVDYADAVTGFEFKGRQGTAVIKGIVVAAEFREAVIEVLEGFEAERSAAAVAELTRECLRLWRRFMIALRVKERVSAYARDDESDENAEDEFNESDPGYEESDDEGGFVPKPELQTRVSSSRSRLQTVAGTVQGDFTVIEGPKIEDLQAWSEEHQGTPRKSSAQSKEKLGAGLDPEDPDGSLFGDSDDPQEPPLGGGFVVDEEEEPASDQKSTLPESTVDPANVSATVPKMERFSMIEDARSPSYEEDGAGDTKASDLGSKREHGLDGELPTPENVGDDRLGASGERSETSARQDDDRGSLLSEDPEDFDADPDWLN